MGREKNKQNLLLFGNLKLRSPPKSPEKITEPQCHVTQQKNSKEIQDSAIETVC